METAYFAGGCFWCITPIFKLYGGVQRVLCGYAGGAEENPTYEDVKHQRTGHRETIRVDFDPDETSFSQLLDIFLRNVDPFDGGGQFIDRGASYTLAIYCTNEAQRALSENRIRKLEAESGRRVHITVAPFSSFYEAEEDHQDYYIKHPEAFRQELIDSGRKNREEATQWTTDC